MSGDASVTAKNRRALWMVFGLTFTYFLVEIAGGIATNSLALLADAAHMLTDVGGLGLALFAAWMSSKPATPQRTYGYYRVEILAALYQRGCLVPDGIFHFDFSDRTRGSKAVGNTTVTLSSGMDWRLAARVENSKSVATKTCPGSSQESPEKTTRKGAPESTALVATARLIAGPSISTVAS